MLNENYIGITTNIYLETYYTNGEIHDYDDSQIKLVTIT